MAQLPFRQMDAVGLYDMSETSCGNDVAGNQQKNAAPLGQAAEPMAERRAFAGAVVVMAQDDSGTAWQLGHGGRWIGEPLFVGEQNDGRQPFPCPALSIFAPDSSSGAQIEAARIIC